MGVSPEITMELPCKTSKKGMESLYYAMQKDILTLAQRHYENFPVGSMFVRKDLRKALHLYYAFARTADDIADEGTMTPEERIESLTMLQKMFHDALNGDTSDPFFTKLAASIKFHDIAPRLFDQLITAFRQDAVNPIYATLEELEGYCRNSAHPVGKMVLQLFKYNNIATVKLSDPICTALQMTNFWQDISVDTARNRFYIPAAIMREFKVDYEDLRTLENTDKYRVMMKVLVKTTKRKYLEGKNLIYFVPKDLRLELKLIWNGGLRILEKIEMMDYDTRRFRPTLDYWDKLVILLRAMAM